MEKRGLLFAHVLFNQIVNFREKNSFTTKFVKTHLK